MNSNQHHISEHNDFLDICDVHNQIDEFDKVEPEFFKNRCQNNNYLMLLAFYNNEPSGYMVAYDRYQDGSLYCWMGGVINQYRNAGVYSNMAKFRQDWAKKNGYKSLKIKTRNDRNEMLHWLIKNNFKIIC